MADLLKHPLQLNGNGEFNRLPEGDEYYAQELYFLLKTEMGERELTPEFGTSDLTFANNSNVFSDLQIKATMFGIPVEIDSAELDFVADDRATAVVSFSDAMADTYPSPVTPSPYQYDDQPTEF